MAKFHCKHSRQTTLTSFFLIGHFTDKSFSHVWVDLNDFCLKCAERLFPPLLVDQEHREEQQPVWHMLQHSASLADKSCTWAVLLAMRHIVVHVAELDKWSASSTTSGAHLQQRRSSDTTTATVADNDDDLDTLSPFHTPTRRSAHFGTLHLCQVGGI
jgi:hypothetical protein